MVHMINGQQASMLVRTHSVHMVSDQCTWIWAAILSFGPPSTNFSESWLRTTCSLWKRSAEAEV